MSTIKLPPESEVVSWLQQLIEKEELLESIQGQEAITSLTDAVDQEYFLPSFGIDYISRRASAEAADHVLNRLGLLEIISINTSISLTTGEVLRPDILCFNPETKTLVVFEVKRASETERQTVTELAGYEQELRNMLPFLGNFDVCFVVVAADWSTLLVHAVGSMNAWSGKQYLALKLTNDVSGFGLLAHLPEAWHLTGSTNLPVEALPSIDLYLAYKGIDDLESERGDIDSVEGNEDDERLPPRIVLTAMDVIAREGDRAGSHGFMMLWRDVNGFGRGRWCITLTAIDPYAMHSWCRDHGLPQRESEAATFLHNRRDDLLGQTPQTVYDIAKAAFPLLKEHFDPEFGGDFHWQLKTRQYRNRVVPTRFDFWGALGQHAREFVSNPAVRNNYMPFVGLNQLDWTDPAVAMTLVANLSLGAPFPRGVIKCSDAFLTGRVLGDLAVAAFNAVPDKVHAARIEPMVEWAQLEALRFAIEMKQMYVIAEEVVTPMPMLSNDPAKRLESTEMLAQWVRADLISKQHPFHQACFDLGYRHALLFNLLSEQAIDRLSPDEPRAAVCIVRSILKGVLLRAVGSQGQVFKSSGFLQLIAFLEPHLGLNIDLKDESAVSAAIDAIGDEELLADFSGTIVKGVDSIIPVVLHTTRPPFPARVDWEWLKGGVKALFESGDHCPAVIFSQDGMVGSGRLEEPFRCVSSISDPEVEVYVLDESSARNIALKLTWNELKEFHAKRSQGY
ncbi:hypothetical protein [Pseudomonas orientalis]|uniref:Uncharacterized protein n=1 Tax=Pseudomonas orientalis TaxID=76758 RepID=A0A1H2GXC3_9PSED|nr:hypothetical protein [Pseudomonas orientalis]KRP64698.1 hypothetical protein TU82_17160 [Pseudomonas orientalis]SDU24161.1 hypothetical protein SAMN04490197_4142 [Pseudomonas orientalis]